MSNLLRAAVLTLGLQLLVGCDAGTSDESKLDKPCSSNVDCASGEMLSCGVNTKGERTCLPSCASLTPGYVCADGVPTACAFAPSHCKECGCASDQYCVDDVGCTPKQAVGEPCKNDDQCESRNCSAVENICRVPLQSACTSENCDVCLSTDSWSYCSRGCNYRFDCEGRPCVDNFCRQDCHTSASSCPGRLCDTDYDTQSGEYFYYCRCSSSNGCAVTQALRSLGKSCFSNAICESDLCDGAVVFDDATGYPGLCSKPCTSTADCGSGFACAAIAPAHCLPTCTDSCAIGSCLAAPTTEGTTQNVCWAKRQVNATCGKPSDCMSGNCVNGKCGLPAG
jgi:hypothetical protein